MCYSASMGNTTIPTLINNLNTLTNGIKLSNKEHNTEISDILDAMELKDNIHTYLGSRYCPILYIPHIRKENLYFGNGEVLIYNNLSLSQHRH